MSKRPPKRRDSTKPVRPTPHPGPRVHWAQVGKTNDAPDAIFLSSAYGLIPDDWQEPIVYAWLGRRADGKWCHGRCGLAVPRQNGKNGVIEIRELWGMIELGEAILHTAHEVKTARKAFKRLKHFFGNTRDDPKAKFPELNALVEEVRNTNGQEAIVLRDQWQLVDGRIVRSSGAPELGAKLIAKGGSVEFVARSSGSGRGYTADVLILDEAQHLDDDELEALRSAVSSAPLGDPQVIYAGTPPDREKNQTGEVWLRIRAMAGKVKRTCWIEYGAPDGPLPDLEDTDLLFAANPALELRHGNGAYGLQMDTVNDERGDLSPEGYARERLGWWGNPLTRRRGVIDMSQWTTLKITAGPPKRAQIVVDVAPDLEYTTIALASDAPPDPDDRKKKTLVLVDWVEGTNGVIKKIEGLIEDLEEVLEVALTPTAALFSPMLTKAKVKHKVLTNADVARGCTAFQEMVRTGTVAHVNQQEFNDAVRNAITRYVVDSQHWDRRDRRIDISAIVAGSVAAQRWVANSANKKPPPPAPVRATTTTTRTPTRPRTDNIAHAGF